MILFYEINDALNYFTFNLLQIFVMHFARLKNKNSKTTAAQVQTVKIKKFQLNPFKKFQFWSMNRKMSASRFTDLGALVT